MVTCGFAVLASDLDARNRTKLIGDDVYHPDGISAVFGQVEN
jgi:hypothetical protein